MALRRAFAPRQTHAIPGSPARSGPRASAAPAPLAPNATTPARPGAPVIRSRRGARSGARSGMSIGPSSIEAGWQRPVVALGAPIELIPTIVEIPILAARDAMDAEERQRLGEGVVARELAGAEMFFVACVETVLRRRDLARARRRASRRASGGRSPRGARRRSRGTHRRGRTDAPPRVALALEEPVEEERVEERRRHGVARVDRLVERLEIAPIQIHEGLPEGPRAVLGREELGDLGEDHSASSRIPQANETPGRRGRRGANARFPPGSAAPPPSPSLPRGGSSRRRSP